jgi:penicillin-binding protein 1C
MRRCFALVLSTLWLLAATGALLDWLFPPNLSRLTAVGTEVLDREGRPLALLPAAGGVWRFRADPRRVSPLLLDLLITIEDRRFRLHPGVDPIALARAIGQLIRTGRVVSGGSTLAMQAARLLEPRPRTIGAKLLEIARALQLQHRYGRDGVLEIWLTLAPFGGNLDGIRAGSLAWFGRPPDLLEPAQAALLVAIPRRPEALRPDRHPDRARLLRDRILAAGAQAGHFAPPDPPPVPNRRVALPRHAPQVVARLPRHPTVVTTLELPLQAGLERLSRQLLQGLPERASLALLIADAETRDIRAIVAGDWRNEARAGTLDLTRAVRSPGSALKPFIYGMAFAEGIAAPEAVVTDLPRRYGGYAPENFDRAFTGTVTAADALRRSLNLPAVALLERIGPLRFATELRLAGAPLTLPPHAAPALPLALGGAGITLRHLAGLYAALATDGTAVPLRLTPDEPDSRRHFLPPRAARMVASVLTRPLPAGGPGGIAWKTGTSWGGRDAWALGFDRRHVVGVWVGRPDGTPIPKATGLSLAMPMLGRVFGLLPPAPRAVPSPARPAAAPLTTRADPGDRLRLLFPPAGAVLAGTGPVTIRVMGGERPMTFMVDGRPLHTEAVRREAGWLPDGPGFYHITVLDARGAAVRAAIRIRQE